MRGLSINIGNRKHGFKSIATSETTTAIVKKDTVSVKRYIPLLAATAVGTVAYLTLGCDAVSAAPVDINVKPIEDYTMSVYWTGFKVLLWLTIPFYGWCAYALAFSGSNAAKRTAAKITAIFLVVGTALYAAAPWIGHTVYDASRAIFDKHFVS